MLGISPIKDLPSSPLGLFWKHPLCSPSPADLLLDSSLRKEPRGAQGVRGIAAGQNCPQCSGQLDFWFQLWQLAISSSVDFLEEEIKAPLTAEPVALSRKRHLDTTVNATISAELVSGQSLTCDVRASVHSMASFPPPLSRWILRKLLLT